MAVRSKELGSVALTSGSLTAIYTVPAGKTAIIKEWVAYAAGTMTALLKVTRGGTTLTVGRGSITSTVPYIDKERFLVLEPGDVLSAQRSGGTDTVDVWVSGAELDGVAT